MTEDLYRRDHYGAIIEGDRVGAWYQSATGHRLYPLDPRVEDVRVLDIARGLANECRFGRMLGKRGQWYSVAEHSLLVSQHVALLYPGCTDWQQEALLHDAAEAYGFGDVPRPLKHEPSVRPTIDGLEDRWTAAIYARFGIESNEGSLAAIKHVDQLIILDEIDAVTRNPGSYSSRHPQHAERLHARITCMSPGMAEVAFLRAVGQLFPAFAAECHHLIRNEPVAGEGM